MNIAGTVALFVLLRRRLHGLELRRTVGTVGRMLVAAAPLALATFGVWKGLDAVLGRTFAAQLVAVVAALVVGGGVYVVSCRLLGVRELDALLSLRGRFRRA